MAIIPANASWLSHTVAARNRGELQREIVSTGANRTAREEIVRTRARVAWNLQLRSSGRGRTYR
jgi:hypothetical protein